jgi:hypothetical protein
MVHNELTISGKIGLDGMRKILQHPELLGRVPYLLETPKHLPQYRTLRRRSKSIQAQDDELARLERDTLKELLAFNDRDWADQRLRAEWWDRIEKQSRIIKRKIGKLIRTRIRSQHVWN